MPRFKNAVSGVEVSVSDETAERLDSVWVPVDGKPTRGGRKPKAEATAVEVDAESTETEPTE
ncbi:MAG TPA: hypothetical protein VFU07_07140 [Candidatus Lumbricidophila sp.]|nr:hypothetical protein [Candidatus Lumbricidophila sp.]